MKWNDFQLLARIDQDRLVSFQFQTCLNCSECQKQHRTIEIHWAIGNLGGPNLGSTFLARIAV